MCYFIDLTIQEQNKEKYAIEHMKSICNKYRNILSGKYPNYKITDGHCSCDFLTDQGKQLNIDLSILKEIIIDKSIKSIEIGWYWNNANYEDHTKLELTEFVDKNSNNQLKPNISYHINDLSKFRN